jgi:hypothetical protein
VVPKGATATPPRTVQSVQKKAVAAAPTPLGAQPVQRHEPPQAPLVAPTPPQQTRAGPRPTVNLLASPPPPAAPRSLQVAASAEPPVAPSAAAPRRPVRSPAVAHTRAPAATDIRDVDLLVLTRDKAMVQLLESVVEKRRRLHAAGDLERAIPAPKRIRSACCHRSRGARGRDLRADRRAQAAHVPELVTIVVSGVPMRSS